MRGEKLWDKKVLKGVSLVFILIPMVKDQMPFLPESFRAFFCSSLTKSGDVAMPDLFLCCLRYATAQAGTIIWRQAKTISGTVRFVLKPSMGIRKIC